MQAKVIGHVGLHPTAQQVQWVDDRLAKKGHRYAKEDAVLGIRVKQRSVELASLGGE